MCFSFRFLPLLAALMIPATGIAADNPFSAEECSSSFLIEEVDTAPVPIEQNKPEIPDDLAGIKASVVVAFIIDERGRVTAERIVQSTNPAFDGLALDCVRGWKYEPGVKNGAKVKVRVVVPIRFNMAGRFR